MEKLGFMNILQDLDNEYFECCKDLLTEWYIPFKYIKKQNIRKEDIAERLYRLSKNPDKESVEAGSFKDYAKDLETLFTYFFRTVNNSRAEKYMNRGKEVCGEILKKHAYTVDNFMDITKILICFSREVFRNRLKTPNQSPVLDINFEMESSDIQLIQSLNNREFRFDTPQLVGKKKEKLSGTSIYCLASIFLCHLLQNEGLGVNKENANAEGESDNV